MNEKNLDNLNRVIIGSLIATMAVLPLVFTPLLWHSFELAKIMVFNWLVLWLMVLFIVKTVSTRQLIRPGGNLIVVSWSLYILIRFLSALNSEYASVAFFGSGLRGFGLITELELWFFAYFIFSSLPLIKTYLKYFLSVISMTAVLAGIYGLAQVAGFDYYRWQLFDSVQLRATSTIGQPNQLAAYLLLSLSLSAWGYLISKSRAKFFYFLAILIQLLTLIFTMSRGAWLGAVIAGLLSAFVYAVRQGKQQTKKPVVYLFVLLFFCSVSLVFLADKNFHNINPLLGRAMSVFNSSEGSYRFYLYHAGLGLVAKRPLLGYGPDTQIFQIFPYYQGSWAITEAINISSDRFHNLFLDLAFESGLLAVVLLLWFASLLVRRVATYLGSESGNSPDGLIVILLSAGLFSFLISLQFSFLAIVPAIYAAFISGVIIGQIDDGQALKLDQRRYLLIALLPFLVWLAFYSLQSVRASLAMRQATLALSFEGLIRSVEQIVKTAPANQYESFYQAELFRMVRPYLNDKTVSRPQLKMVLADILSDKSQPATFGAKLNQLMLLSDLLPFGKTGRTNPLFISLESKFGDFKHLAPGYAIIEMAWGDLYYRAGDYPQALAHYEQAIKLYPLVTEKLMNAEHRTLVVVEEKLVIKKTADTAIKLGKHDLALSYVALGQKLEPVDVDWFKLRLRIYKEQKNQIKIKETLRAAGRLFPAIPI